MRNFLQRLMYGRYGNDQLNMFLLVAYLVFYLLAAVTKVGFLSYVGLFAIILCFLRMFSRQIDRRRAENAKFLKLTAPVTKWYKLRRAMHRDRDHAYFKCPNCKQTLRVPKGKGKITITCRSCGTSFQEKT